MRILIPVSVGEHFDKISILEIKQDKIHSPEKLTNIRTELSELRDITNNLPSDIVASDDFKILYQELKNVNLDLWTLEDRIREKEEINSFDEEFITLARGDAIYNDKRHVVKRKINELFNSHIVEEKSYAESTLLKHQNFRV